MDNYFRYHSIWLDLAIAIIKRQLIEVGKDPNQYSTRVLTKAAYKLIDEIYKAS